MGSAHRVWHIPLYRHAYALYTHTIQPETMYENDRGYEIMAWHDNIILQLVLPLPLCPLCCCQLFKNAFYWGVQVAQRAKVPCTYHLHATLWGLKSACNLCRISSPASSSFSLPPTPHPPPHLFSSPDTNPPIFPLSLLCALQRGRIVLKTVL